MEKNDNKKEKDVAVALRYKPEQDEAPRVVAKGENKIAENIVEKAKEHDIPIYEDEKLSRQLNALELEQTIPTELYEAVAQVLIFISEIDNETI